MNGFTATIKEASKDLTARERIAIKDTGACISLDEITTTEGHITIDYAYHVVLAIHNERSDNKDYEKIITVDKDGSRYITGSNSYYEALTDIVTEMSEAGEGDNIVLDVYRMESKNYKGKSFITVSLK